MGQFTAQTRQTVEDFAASMQFSAPPAPAADGSYTFVFDRLGTLSLLATDDGKNVLAALGRAPLSGDDGTMELFLEGAGLDPLNNQPLNAGLAPDGTFYYVMPIPSASFDLPTLEQTLDRLAAAHDALGSY